MRNTNAVLTTGIAANKTVLITLPGLMRSSRAKSARVIKEETIQMVNSIPSNDITIPFNLDNSIAQSGIKVKSHLTTPTELSIRNRTPSSSLYFSE